MASLDKRPRSQKRWLLPVIVILLLAVLLLVIQFVLRLNIFGFLKNLFYLKYLPKLGSNTTLLIVFVFGLLTSVHCVAMCGGLMLTQAIKSRENAAETRKNALWPAAFYNLGRIISYMIIGAVVGGIGQVLSLSDQLKGLIPIIGGIFMVIMAVNLLGIFPVLRYLQIGLPKSVVRKLRGIGGGSPMVVGLLTGLMPCGPMQMVQLYALGTKSIFLGSLSMGVFALGTVPGLFTFGAFSSLISRKYTGAILRCSAVLVAVLGVVMIGRGLALSGVSLPTISILSQNASDGFAKSTVKGNIQTVTTTVGDSNFPPIEVTQGIRVVWTIKMPKDICNDCNNAMLIPTYSLEKKLAVGDNMIEFTPKETGDFPYTCWMGMIKSKIRVVAASVAKT